MYEDKIKTSFIYLIVLLEQVQLQWPGRPHPTRQSRVVFEDVASVWVDEDAEGFQSVDCFGETIGGTHDRGPRLTANQVNKVPVSCGEKVSTSNMATGWGPTGSSRRRETMSCESE